jgi:hypothetical protein
MAFMFKLQFLVLSDSREPHYREPHYREPHYTDVRRGKVSRPGAQPVRRCLFDLPSDILIDNVEPAQTLNDGKRQK